MSLGRRFLLSLAAGAAVAAVTWATPYRQWWWVTGGVVFAWAMTGIFPDLN
ncbi:hypothetical protein GTY54_22420 [Streptomyces sp. SID625]|nr:hypothetical protein [Streptomyces sp. SID625]